MGRGARDIFLGGRLPVAGPGKWGRRFPRLQRIPGYFLMARNDPRHRGCQGMPGECDSHGCCTPEPTRSFCDPGAPPRSSPIACTGYLSILGIAGGPDLPDRTPYQVTRQARRRISPLEGISQTARKAIRKS